MSGTGPLMVPVGTPRRVFVIVAVLGGVVLAGASVLGHPLIGILFLVGLALGTLNNVLTVRSILKHISAGDPNRKQYAKSSLVRLGYISLFALVFVAAFRRDGIAVLAGLAIFHLLASVASALPVLKEFRKV
ncbi:putative integral membrane protein [Acidothermus cellulolyticus 11B]|uniref:Putative integral membrane protein n=1 Tax=Acidothermus cellulolyticus (strain ATCC 43068 / DSM 8971 / 11B) TaxID=351607 RepID=A0LSK9_ACIC1|nr:ATP synthase subunit I [Acidothermus cellulolyticus]ABK52419.1 putative integral membrane protein [Acidothermus cellulolyticus 11B]